MAGGVRQDRRNAIRGTRSTILVLLRLRRIMEQQITMLLQQVMEMTDRWRQNEESSEQVRQLLEAHRTAEQMLEERVNWTEASVRDTFQAGDNSAARAQEAPGVDVKASVFCNVSARSRHFVNVDVIFLFSFCVRQLLRFNIFTWPRMSKFLSRIA